MDTEKCRALLTAIERQSLSDAAEELGYTPSGMSRMMVSLEDEFGFRLLERSRKGVTATRECEQILPDIRAFVRNGDLLTQKSSEITGAIRGEVVVGTAYNAYYPHLAAIIREFGNRYPDVRIAIQEGRSSVLMRGVEQHQVDFAVISRREGRCEWIPLYDDEMIMWVPPDHPLADADSYPIRRAEEDPYILLYNGKETDSAAVFQKYDIHPNQKYQTQDTYAAYAMVAAGLGVTLMNGIFRNVWSGEVCSLKLRPEVRIPLGIAVPVREEISPAARRFRDFALERLRK